jgi:hypothetical protein
LEPGFAGISTENVVRRGVIGILAYVGVDRPVRVLAGFEITGVDPVLARPFIDVLFAVELAYIPVAKVT